MAGLSEIVEADSPADRGLAALVSPEMERAALYERIGNTGWPARQALKIQLALKQDREGFQYDGASLFKRGYYGAIHGINGHAASRRIFDTWFTYAIIGSLTHYDQELFCQLHNNHITPKKITIGNALAIGGTLFCVNLLIAYGASTMDGIHDLMKPVASAGEHGMKGIAYVEMGWNVFRAGYAQISNRGLEPIGLQPLLMNALTYVKRISQYVIQAYLAIWDRA